MLCGLAMARLGLTPAEFYDITPAELFHAIQGRNFLERNQAQMHYEVAQYIVFHVWNASGRLRRRLTRFWDVGKFPWQGLSKKSQTVEEMKQELLSIVGAFGKGKGLRPSEKRKLRMKK